MMRRNPEFLIAVSCHNDEEVARACSEGANFVVFGPVFEKKDSPVAPTGLETFRTVCRNGIPVLALGGVNLANAQSCLDAGAAGIAGVRLFQNEETADVVRKLRP
jgi:thiamine-phosphate pyrophosphorylase